MYDFNGVLQAQTTQTGSFTSASLNIHPPANTTSTNMGGTPRRGLKIRVVVTAISGAPSVTFKVRHSDDSATFTDLSFQLDAAFSAATGVTYIVIETDKPFIQLVETMTGGTAPSISYHAELGISRP